MNQLAMNQRAFLICTLRASSERLPRARFVRNVNFTARFTPCGLAERLGPLQSRSRNQGRALLRLGPRRKGIARPAFVPVVAVQQGRPRVCRNHVGVHVCLHRALLQN